MKVERYGAEAHTCDRYQGREADFTIVCATRHLAANEQVDAKLHSFMLDDSRATVALTRARHGVFILGHIELLQHNGVWDRFLDEISTEVPVRHITDLNQMLGNGSPEAVTASSSSA